MGDADGDVTGAGLNELWNILYHPEKADKSLFEWKHLHLRAVWQAGKDVPQNLIVVEYIELADVPTEVASALVDVIQPKKNGDDWFLRTRPLVSRDWAPPGDNPGIWTTSSGYPGVDIPQLQADISFPKIKDDYENQWIAYYQRGDKTPGDEKDYENFMKALTRAWKAKKIGFINRPVDIQNEISVRAANWSMGITITGLGYRRDGETSIIKTTVASGTSLGLQKSEIGVHYAGLGIGGVNADKTDWTPPLAAMFLDTLFLDSFSFDPHVKGITWPADGALASFFNLPKGKPSANVWVHDAKDKNEKKTNVSLKDVISYAIDEKDDVLEIVIGEFKNTPLENISFLFPKTEKEDQTKAEKGRLLMDFLTGNPVDLIGIKAMLKKISSDVTFKSETEREEVALKIFGNKDLLRKPVEKKIIDKQAGIDNTKLSNEFAKGDKMIVTINQLQTTFSENADNAFEAEDSNAENLGAVLAMADADIRDSKNVINNMIRDLRNMKAWDNLSKRLEEIKDHITQLETALESLLEEIKAQSRRFLDRDYVAIDALLKTLDGNVDAGDTKAIDDNMNLLSTAMNTTRGFLLTAHDYMDPEDEEKQKKRDDEHLKLIRKMVTVENKEKEEAEQKRKKAAEIIRLQEEAEQKRKEEEAEKKRKEKKKKKKEDKEKEEEEQERLRLEEEKKQKEKEDKILLDKTLENLEKVKKFVAASNTITGNIEASFKIFSDASDAAELDPDEENSLKLFTVALGVILKDIIVTIKTPATGLTTSTGLFPTYNALVANYEKMVENSLNIPTAITAHNKTVAAWEKMRKKIIDDSRGFLDRANQRIKNQQAVMLVALEEDPMNTGEFETNKKKVAASLNNTTKILRLAGAWSDDKNKSYAKTNNALDLRLKALQTGQAAKRTVVVTEEELEKLDVEKKFWEDDFVKLNKLLASNPSKKGKIKVNRTGILNTALKIKVLKERLVIEKKEEHDVLKALAIGEELKGTHREIMYGSAKPPVATILYMLGSRGRIDAQRIREDPIYTGSRGPEVANLSNLSLEFYGSSASALASQLSQNASIRAKNLTPKAVTVDGGRLEQTDFDYYYGLHWVDDYAGFETSGGSVTSSPGKYVAIPDRGALLYHLGATKVGSLSYDFGNMVNQVPLDNPDFEVMLQIPARQDAAASLGSGAIILGLRMPDSGNGLYSVRSVVYAPNLVKM